jgi:hypothetical protein
MTARLSLVKGRVWRYFTSPWDKNSTDFRYSMCAEDCSGVVDQAGGQHQLVVKGVVMCRFWMCRWRVRVRRGESQVVRAVSRRDAALEDV